jgi:hypothetical protein
MSLLFDLRGSCFQTRGNTDEIHYLLGTKAKQPPRNVVVVGVSASISLAMFAQRYFIDFQ